MPTTETTVGRDGRFSEDGPRNYEELISESEDVAPSSLPISPAAVDPGGPRQCSAAVPTEKSRDSMCAWDTEGRDWRPVPPVKRGLPSNRDGGFLSPVDYKPWPACSSPCCCGRGDRREPEGKGPVRYSVSRLALELELEFWVCARCTQLSLPVTPSSNTPVPCRRATLAWLPLLVRTTQEDPGGTL